MKVVTYNFMPSTVKDIVCARVAKGHSLMLNQEPYKRHKGILLRLLLDAFFAGELPVIQMRFERRVKENGTK